jgi:hypothetical protein
LVAVENLDVDFFVYFLIIQLLEVDGFDQILVVALHYGGVLVLLVMTSTCLASRSSSRPRCCSSTMLLLRHGILIEFIE